MVDNENQETEAAAADANANANAMNEDIMNEDANDTSTNTNTTTKTPAQLQEEALAEAEALTANLLSSQNERHQATLQAQHQALTQTCAQHQSTITHLQKSLSDLKCELQDKENGLEKCVKEKEEERKKVEVAEEREKDVCERMARVDVEADSLRQEISRLQNTTNGLNAQITELKASTTLSTSNTAPLQFENTRLKSELSSTNAHTKWLEQELHTKTSQHSSLKLSTSATIRDLRNQLNELKTLHEETQSEKSILELQTKSLRKRFDSSQSQLLQKEQEHGDEVHELKVEIQSERQLVSLQKESIARLEERYNDVVRDMTSLQALVKDAEEERGKELVVIREEVAEEYNRALVNVEDGHKRAMEDLQRNLDDALVEKAQLEDEFMAGNNNPVLQLTNTVGVGVGVGMGGSDEPITLTKLYEKLAEAQDETRTERGERKRLELYLERIHKEIETTAPQQRLERKEFELAMAQNQEMHSRLNEAWEECNTARKDLQQAQRDVSDTTRECRELRLENGDMAQQVQTLLQKSMGGHDLAAEIQEQNQRMLKEHHRMSTTIAELEQTIDSDVVQQKLQELESMKEERENQATLVKNIIHQRDLYRALLVKNDVSLLSEYGADGAIVAAKDQIEKFTEVESENKKLVESLATLNANVTALSNEKIGLEERLARSDTLLNELSTTNTRIQADLLASNSAVARSSAESAFHAEKVSRLEESLEIARHDIQQVNEGNSKLQRLSEGLQSALSISKDEQSKSEEQLRQATVQLRLAEANCNAMKETESRLNAENNSLRSELARHIALQESMQKIEATLSTRGNTEQKRLVEEVETLKSSLSSEKSQYEVSLEKMQNELADADLRVKDNEKQKAEALQQVISAKDQLDSAKAEIKGLSEKSASLEKELNAAKIKLGDSDADTTDQEKIENLANDIATANAEIDASKKKIEDYKAMAESSEKTLADSTKASEAFKKLTMEKLQKLKQELKSASETAKLKQEALEELSKDLSTSRGEQEKVVDDLKASIDALKTELESSKNDQKSSESQRSNVLEELNIYKAEARAAKENYERELALHADARKELQSVREKVEDEFRLHQISKSQLDTFNSELESEKNAWGESKKRLEEAQKHAESRLAESQELNNVLHSQLATLNESFEKLQSERINVAANAEDATANVSDESVSKQISDLQEIIRLMRNEKDVVETQLASARRNAERERAAAEIAKKSLDQLRSEIELLHNEKAEDSRSSGSSEELASKLKQAEDQLVLLRESNSLLRVETDKMTRSLDASKKESELARAAYEPINEKCAALEADKAAFNAEKASLVREVDAWKGRVQGLVKKFNQIDPEEHANALRKVEETEKQCTTLQKEKGEVEKEVASVKSLLSRVNKEMKNRVTSIEAFKAALAKEKKEKELLIKNNAGSSNNAKKELDDLKKAKEAVVKELASSKAATEQQNKRLENLKKILKQNTNVAKIRKEKIDALTVQEKETATALAAALKSRDEALEKLSGVQAGGDVTMPSKSEQEVVVAEVGNSDSGKSEGTSEEPKVPPEGFKFVSSGTTTAVSTAGGGAEATIEKSTSKPSGPNKRGTTKAISTAGGGAEATIEKSTPKPSGLNKPDSGEKKESKSITTPVIQKPVASKNTATQKVSNTTKAIATTTVDEIAKAPVASTTTSTTTKETMAAPIGKESPDTTDVKTANQKPVALSTATKKDTTPVPKSTAPSGTKGKTKENTLREKLMKKKRELAEKMASPPAKRPAPTSTVVASKLPPMSKSAEPPLKPVPPSTDMIEMKPSASKTVSKPPSDDNNSESVKPESALKSVTSEERSEAAKSLLGLNTSAAPFKMFGSGNAAPTFGTASSSIATGTAGTGFGKPSNLSADVLSPFGTQIKKSEETPSSSGAFLNLKPPGSGASTSFVFGTSSNIKLPTPSKDPLPVGQQLFSSFKPQPFGTNPFASSQTTASPFGGIASKKRALDSDQNIADSTSKLAKVEEDSSQQDASSGADGNTDSNQ